MMKLVKVIKRCNNTLNIDNNDPIKEIKEPNKGT